MAVKANNSKQFSTIQANQLELERQKSSKQKKGHLRSLTSQKGPENEQPVQNSQQRNNGRRQPSASNMSGKGRQMDQETQEQNRINDTYGTQIQKQKNDASPRAEEDGSFLPVGKQNDSKNDLNKSSKHNVRASISKEVTTATQNQSVQPR